MKFYNIKQLAFVAVAGLALTSCDKFLDKPSEDSYNTDNYYQTEAQCLGATSYLYNSPWYDFQRGFIKIGEVLSGNYFWGSSPYLQFTVNGTDEDLVNMSASLWAAIGHSNTVYELLHEKYPYAMIQPTHDTFYKQRAPETDIVVQKLLSEAPAPDANHSCVIEKLLVDLLSKKLSGSLIERSEYPRIYEDVFRKYNIDETRMFRYAKRRHLYDRLLSFIKTKTDIHLMTI